MRGMMPWKTCTKEHIKNVEPDKDKIISIMKMCKIRLRVTEEVKLDDETASVIAADYYEVIKELMTALLLKDGLKSDNHECLISYFKEKYPENEYESHTVQD